MKLDRWQDTLKALDDVKYGRLLDADIVEKWMDSWGTSSERANFAEIQKKIKEMKSL